MPAWNRLTPSLGDQDAQSTLFTPPLQGGTIPGTLHPGEASSTSALVPPGEREAPCFRLGLGGFFPPILEDKKFIQAPVPWFRLGAALGLAGGCFTPPGPGRCRALFFAIDDGSRGIPFEAGLLLGEEGHHRDNQQSRYEYGQQQDLFDLFHRPLPKPKRSTEKLRTDGSRRLPEGSSPKPIARTRTAHTGASLPPQIPGRGGQGFDRGFYVRIQPLGREKAAGIVGSMRRMHPLLPNVLPAVFLGILSACASGPSLSSRVRPGEPIQVQVRTGGRVVTVVNRSYFAKKMGSQIRPGWSVVPDAAMGLFVTEQEKLGFFQYAARGSLGGNSLLRIRMGNENWTLLRPRLEDPDERRLNWPKHLSLAFQLFNVGDTSTGSAGLGPGGRVFGEELRRLKKEKVERKKVLRLGTGK